MSIEDILVRTVFDLTGYVVSPNEAFILLHEYLEIYPEFEGLYID